MAEHHVAPPTPAEVVFPTKFRELEFRLIKQRPGRAESADDYHAAPLVGCGISGGGIRSATFALGVFQGLARLNLLGKIDYTSSVSGGGYFAAFLGRLFMRADVTTLAQVNAILAPNDTEPRDEGAASWMCEVFRWLRENGRYLSPRGGGDLLLDLAVVLRNWLSLQVVLATLVIGLCLLLQLLRRVVSHPVAIRHTYTGHVPHLVQFSPYIAVAIAIVVFGALPLGWAYWLLYGPDHDAEHPAAGAPKIRSWMVNLGVTVAAPVAAFALIYSLIGVYSGRYGGASRLAVILIVITVETWVAAWLARRVARTAYAEQSGEFAATAMTGDVRLSEASIARNRLALWMTRVLTGALALAAFGLLDATAGWLFAPREASAASRGLMPLVKAIIVAIIVAAPFAKWAVATLEPRMKNRPQPISMNLLAGIAAAVILLPVFLVLDGIAQGLAAHLGVLYLLLVTLAVFALCYALGQVPMLVNRTTLLPLYAARLTRAYLGASNALRHGASPNNLSDPVYGDDCAQERYFNAAGDGRYAKGAPLHLINVTVSETVDGRSQVEQRDRKGVGMALGPAGISAGVRHHVVFNPADEQPQDGLASQYRGVTVFPARTDNHSSYRVFDYPDDNFHGQPLSLGRWVGISGAAVAPGMGFRTSLGLSLLTGFFNVRLGYWWDAGVTRGARPLTKLAPRIGRVVRALMPAQAYLFDELLSRFPGTAAQHWYLSDGGNFENLATYELIRRRLKFMVTLDAGADTAYEFSDLASLVRKARLDFNAEIAFLDENELDRVIEPAARPYFGTIEQLRRGTWQQEPVADPNLPPPPPPAAALKRLSIDAAEAQLSLRHAALARVTYADGAVAHLLYLKPTLTGDEPVDVLRYHGANPSFPHESTADQFFDEAQWESYRRLGSHIGEQIFRHATPAGGGLLPLLHSL